MERKAVELDIWRLQRESADSGCVTCGGKIFDRIVHSREQHGGWWCAGCGHRIGD